MKIFASITLAVMFLSSSALLADDGDAILGIWKTEEDENGYSHVEIYKNDGKYHGKIVWMLKPTYPEDDEEGMAGHKKIDRNNPDEELRDRPIIGLDIVKDFEYAGDNKWHKGTIYDPANGKTYKCKMELTEEGVLNVRGYIGISLIGRTTEWTRPQKKNTKKE